MDRSYRTPEEMYPVIEDYLASGQTQRAFCEEVDLSLQVFTYWLAKYRREVQSDQDEAAASVSGPAFVELGHAASPEGPVLSAEVVFPSGVRLRLFGSVEPEVLTRLVAGAS